MSRKEPWLLLFKVQVFFSCVAFSIIVPSIAPYLERMGAAEYVLGVAVAVYSLGEMVGSTIFGNWMSVAVRRDPDRGPKRALLTTILVGLLGSVLYVVADAKQAPLLVIAARFLSGVWTGGKMVVEQSYVGEATAPERTTQITSEVGVYAVLGFVVGPSIGALFAPIDFSLCQRWRVDEYTAPGYFMAFLCAWMLCATAWTFDAKAGYHVHPFVVSDDAVKKTERQKKGRPLTPDGAGLALLLFCFFAHFYSFAIQETITTPFVQARFGWSQQQVDYLFAGVGLLSLATSFVVAELAKVCSDLTLLVLSLVLGLVGSLALVDEPLAPPLSSGRFFFGFVNITCAFPFGRNVALAMFSKVLGPTPQGSWMGLMFVVGALPRCFGPSWALYALRFACRLFPDPQPCPPAGRSCLDFLISGTLFALCLVLLALFRATIEPYDIRKDQLLRRRLPVRDPSLLDAAEEGSSSLLGAADDGRRSATTTKTNNGHHRTYSR